MKAFTLELQEVDFNGYREKMSPPLRVMCQIFYLTHQAYLVKNIFSNIFRIPRLLSSKVSLGQALCPYLK